MSSLFIHNHTTHTHSIMSADTQPRPAHAPCGLRRYKHQALLRTVLRAVEVAREPDAPAKDTLATAVGAPLYFAQIEVAHPFFFSDVCSHENINSTRLIQLIYRRFMNPSDKRSDLEAKIDRCFRVSDAFLNERARCLLREGDVAQGTVRVEGTVYARGREYIEISLRTRDTTLTRGPIYTPHSEFNARLTEQEVLRLSANDSGRPRIFIALDKAMRANAHLAVSLQHMAEESSAESCVEQQHVRACAGAGVAWPQELSAPVREETWPPMVW